jgi:DNA-binding response OmpR family regulator
MIAPNKKVILVIEDEEDVRQFIVTVLNDHGFAVLEAADGVEGGHLARERKPHLITLDINLPNKTGVRLYRELRDDPDLARIPIVMVTGVPSEFREFIHHRRVVPPPEGYVAKPFTADELLAAVGRSITE